MQWVDRRYKIQGNKAYHHQKFERVSIGHKYRTDSFFNYLKHAFVNKTWKFTRYFNKTLKNKN